MPAHMKDKEAERTMQPAKDKDGKKEEKPRGQIEGNIFSFSNPERYKTEQLKEQALALLVPGYLQYVYDIN